MNSLRPLLILAWLLALLPADAFASIRPHTFTASALAVSGLSSADPAAGEGSTPLTLHLDGLHDGRVLVRQNPWSSFDPEGLSLWSDTKDYVGGGLIGFGEVVTGNYAGPSVSGAEAHGRQGGRNLAGGVGLMLAVDGLPKIGTGLGMMAGAGAGEAVTAGGATPVALPVGAGGFVIAAAGAVETGTGLLMLSHASGLPPISQPTGNSSGGGSSPEGSARNKQGGAHKDLQQVGDGKEAHHMPADSASPLGTGDGPSIKMDPADHSKTASWGRSKEAQKYQKEQAELIKNGKFKDAQQMDIDDIRSKFGNKYDKGIKEMEDYTKSIPPEKLKP